MAHKFAQKWRSFEFDGENWVEHENPMDLTGMSEDGEVEHGHDPDGFRLIGAATANSLLTLRAEGGEFSYVGVLTYEKGDRIAISGVKHFKDDETRARHAERRRGAAQPLDQDDPPWVVTKP